MYNRIGRKIKTWAKVIFIVEAIGLVFAGLVLIATEPDFVRIGLLLPLIGVPVAWVSSWILYGYGELIDKVCDIEQHMCREDGKSQTQSKADNERLDKLESLRSRGLITEEEYQRAVSKEAKGESW